MEDGFRMQSLRLRAIVGMCDVCGGQVEQAREARHDLAADGKVACLRCEQLRLESELVASNVALDILEAAVKAALRGNASPQDLTALVARCITKETERRVPAEPQMVLLRDRSRNVQRLHGLDPDDDA
jgi:hypothetical protein